MLSWAKLAIEGDTIRAIEVLDRAVAEMPFSQIRHNYQSLPLIEAYYMAGADEKGNAILNEYAGILEENIAYYLRFEGKRADMVNQKLRENISLLYELYNISNHFDQKKGRITKFFIDHGLMGRHRFNTN